MIALLVVVLLSTVVLKAQAGFIDDCTELNGHSDKQAFLSSASPSVKVQSCLVLHTTSKKWAEAAASCDDMPLGNLLVVYNVAHSNKLKTLLDSNLTIAGGSHYELWIGLNQTSPDVEDDDEKKRENWKWRLGSVEVDADGLPWYTGQPNDGGSGGEDCAIFYYGNEGAGLADRSCTGENYFICQYIDMSSVFGLAMNLGANLF